MNRLRIVKTLAFMALISLTALRSSYAQPLSTEGESMTKSWFEPTPPFHIVGPIYYVGTRGLATYLIATSQGLILLDGALPRLAPLIDSSIRKLGFDPANIKIILAGHAHIDHVGTHAYFKKLSKAKVAIMLQEADLLRSGGKKDFHYGKLPAFWYPPVRADRQLLNKSVITLGEVAMMAVRTPGHTKGATTWIMDVTEGGKTYNVVFPDGYSVNPGYRIAVNPSYPQIEDDFRTTFAFLRSLTPDIFLPAHAAFFDMEKRRAAMATEGVNAWVDTAGYRKFIIGRQALFDAAVRNEVKGINLANTTWQLVKYQGRGKDTTILTPAKRSNYTVTFGKDGRASLKVDCNRCAGTWKLGGWGEIQLGMLALTRAACPTQPLTNKIPADWPTLNYFKIREDHLFLSSKPNGSFYEFEAVPGTEPWKR